jgi:hypothetical protein
MKSLPVLYRDEQLVAVNKPSGLLVHRSAIDRHEPENAMKIVREILGDLKLYPYITLVLKMLKIPPTNPLQSVKHKALREPTSLKSRVVQVLSETPAPRIRATFRPRPDGCRQPA